MAEDRWDPQQYDRFRAERQQPFFDLLALVQRRPQMTVVDLGCGTGELTRQLHRALVARQTTGIDRSPAMLAKSAAFAGDGLSFSAGEIAEVAEQGAFDLVFSNAALQWVADHERLLPRLAQALREGGQFAVQVPANQDHPSHRVAEALAGTAPYAEQLGGYIGHRNVLAPERYAEILDALGFAEQRVRLEVYCHRLPSTASVVEWVKGTLLTGFAARMPAALYRRFETAYRQQLFEVLGERSPYLFAFKRILLWGRLAGTAEVSSDSVGASS